MKRCIKKKWWDLSFNLYMYRYVYDEVGTYHAGTAWLLHGQPPCTYHLLHWMYIMYIMYDYILHCDKSSVVFQVSHFHVAFSCLAPVGQENPCLFRQRVMK